MDDITQFVAVECAVFQLDEDSTEQPLGTVFVPIPQLYNLKVVNWCPLEEGSGDHFCELASGELLVEIEVRYKL